MKKFISIACALALTLSANTFYAFAAAPLAPESVEPIPSIMQPDTILIYDDTLAPQIVSGGYSLLKSVPSKQALFNPVVEVPEDASEDEAAQIELENQIAAQLYDDYVSGNYTSVDLPEPCAGMKVEYDSDGVVEHIYYQNESESSGYSLHNPLENAKETRATEGYPWGWGRTYPSVLTYQPNSDSFLGTGRATYYDQDKGNRDNYLEEYDCATQKTYDYSKKGDKDVQIRNLDTDKAFTYYQADVGTLPEAIIDIWGLTNLHELLGSNNDDSVIHVRYYHKRFSDQAVPQPK